jgi:hypothetical protein
MTRDWRGDGLRDSPRRPGPPDLGCRATTLRRRRFLPEKAFQGGAIIPALEALGRPILLRLPDKAPLRCPSLRHRIQVNLNPAVEPLENGSLTLAATSYKTGTCHPKGELRSSWISPAYNCLQLEWGFNCRI